LKQKRSRQSIAEGLVPNWDKDFNSLLLNSRDTSRAPSRASNVSMQEPGMDTSSDGFQEGGISFENDDVEFEGMINTKLPIKFRVCQLRIGLKCLLTIIISPWRKLKIWKAIPALYVGRMVPKLPVVLGKNLPGPLMIIFVQIELGA
jgi:hypothetical protein